MMDPDAHKHPWQRTLLDYISPYAHVNFDFTVDEREFNHAFEKLKQRAQDVDPSDIHPHPEVPGLSYVLSGFRLMLFGEDGRQLLAGDTISYPAVAPEQRGKGYGAELRFLRDILGVSRNAYCYTESGFRAARSAHRLHVERAMRAGQSIPEEVMADYALIGGELKLKAPYEGEDHNRRVEEQKLLDAEAHLFKRTAGYDHVFMTPQDYLDDRSDHLKGLPAALAILQEVEGEIVIQSDNGSLCWIYAKTAMGFCSQYGISQNMDNTRERPKYEGLFFLSGKDSEGDTPSSVQLETFASVEDLRAKLSSNDVRLSPFAVENLLHDLDQLDLDATPLNFKGIEEFRRICLPEECPSL